jgi:ribose transport system substrate-binding protein
MKLMRAVALVGLALMAAAALASCQSGKSDDSKKIIIGVVAKSQGNPVFQAAKVGAEDAAKELSAKYGVEVVIDWQTPPSEDAETQAQYIEQLARKGAKGITVSCSDANTVKPAIDKAVDLGAVVMCFDSDSPDSKRLCYYGTDDITCGKMVMQELAKQMGDKGEIAILAGNQSAPNLRNRVNGVLEELKNHPNMKLFDEAKGVVYHPEVAEQAAQAVEEAQRVHPNIQGWAMIGGWPLFARNALKWNPGTVKVVAVDALPEELAYLESGHVQTLFAQDCYAWGHKSVEILLEKIINGKDPEGMPRIVAPLTPVKKADVAAWQEKWKKWAPK